jgi:ribosomal protein S18 acetylase RimI-like enzyme
LRRNEVQAIDVSYAEGTALELRLFKQEDMERILYLANANADFDRPISEADLVIAKFFPEGFWVAEENNQVVGFVYGHCKEIPAEILTRWGASKAAEITLLVVDPQYQNRGIGAALLQKLLEAFKKASVDVVTLHCPADAKSAKHLYEKLGFEVRAYHMKKSL